MSSESSSTSNSGAAMARRLPFVGRLYLCIPPFRSQPLLSPVPEMPFAPSSPTPVEEDAATAACDANPAIESAASTTSSFALFRRRKRRRNVKGTTANGSFSWVKYSQEYIALIFSFFILLLESFLRVVTLALPSPVINFFYGKSRSLFNAFSPKRHTTVESSRVEKSLVEKVRDADGFVELCEIWNEGRHYRVEEHVVQTGDGYLLGLHRLVRRTSRERALSQTRSRRRSDERGNGGRKVVYLHHGLLMNSEVWVCQLDKEQNLPFILADKGYDVWLGNNRGNKYSKKSIHHPSSAAEFWDFSIDDFAFHDIPDSIDYILETTKQRSLSYVGFSQGTAQAFATLSIHPTLNEKVDVFIALAPAMSPAGLSNAVVDALMKTSPNMLYLFFGRKSILSSATFWQSILYPPIFVRVIDIALISLFNWTGVNISLNQKIASYSHLYSFTSVKSVVHWFQIMRNKTFQMYDDDIQSSLTATFSARSFYKVARFPTRNITTPIHLVYGGSDSLVDINVMLKELPSHTVAKEVPHFEHLDFLWGQDVQHLVFPHVFEALGMYSSSPQKQPSTPENLEDETPDGLTSRKRVATTLKETLPGYSEDEFHKTNDARESDGTQDTLSPPLSSHRPSNYAPARSPPRRNIFPSSGLMHPSSPVAARSEGSESEGPMLPMKVPDNTAAPIASAQNSAQNRPNRSSSIGSNASLMSVEGRGSPGRVIGERGIQIGMSRAMASVSTSNAEDSGLSPPSRRPRAGRRKSSGGGRGS